MSKLVAIFVDSDFKSYEVERALKALHEEYSITLYAVAALSKDASGRVQLKNAADRSLEGTAVGMLTGGLLGILGGALAVAAAPAAAIAAGAAAATGGLAGMATGALAGSFWDLYNAGVSADFIQEVTSHLDNGQSAVLAEIDEDWQTPLDTRMAALGAVVVRTWRADFEDREAELAAEQDAKEYEAAKAELKADWNDTKDHAKARVEKAKAALQATNKRIKDDIEKFEVNTKAKIDAIDKQVAKATGEAKARLEKRRDELKADRVARSAKLKQAWELTKEALA